MTEYTYNEIIAKDSTKSQRLISVVVLEDGDIQDGKVI